MSLGKTQLRSCFLRLSSFNPQLRSNLALYRVAKMTSSHQEIIDKCKLLIPPLSYELHKGQAGRIGVLGGSADYTGAPFFSSMSSLKLGADLAHIICEPDAGNTIKTYSPDLIVHRVVTPSNDPAATVESILSRLHVIVIGPGMGREEPMFSFARACIEYSKRKNMYIVLDADGLFYIQDHLDLIRGYKRAVLTPNVVEFSRLCKAAGLDVSPGESAEKRELCQKLASALGGVTVIEKGAEERISNGQQELINTVEGSPRRCGGQGDFLSGTLGTFLAWAKRFEEGTTHGRGIEPELLPMYAAYCASTVTRTTSKLCFRDMRRSMQSRDMLNYVGVAFEEVFGKEMNEPKL